MSRLKACTSIVSKSDFSDFNCRVQRLEKQKLLYIPSVWAPGYTLWEWIQVNVGVVFTSTHRMHLHWISLHWTTCTLNASTSNSCTSIASLHQIRIRTRIRIGIGIRIDKTVLKFWTNKKSGICFLPGGWGTYQKANNLSIQGLDSTFNVPAPTWD